MSSMVEQGPGARGKGLRRANEILKLAGAIFAQAELEAGSSSGGLHQPVSQGVRGRVALQGIASCPVGLSKPCSAVSGRFEARL